MSDPIEIKIDNKKIESKLLDLAQKSENLRPLMKNIAGIFAYSTEENFKEEGRPKWENLKDSTIKQRTKKKQWPGMILQVTGQLASSVNTYYDNMLTVSVAAYGIVDVNIVDYITQVCFYIVDAWRIKCYAIFSSF